MAFDMKSSYNRFRVSRASPPAHSEGSTTMVPTASAPRRSASPDSGAEKPLQTSGEAGAAAGAAAAASAAAAARQKSIPACDRCRVFKKKCSRTFPACALCASAGQKCSFSTPASSHAAQTHHLRARVDWLSRHLNQSLPAGVGSIEDVETGTNLSELLRDAPVVVGHRGHNIHGGRNDHEGSSPGAATSSSARTGTRDPRSDDQRMLDQDCIEVIPDDGSVCSSSRHSNTHTTAPSRGSQSGQASLGSDTSITASRLPPDAAARRFVDAYFRNVNRAYPFVDRAKVLNDLEALDDFAGRRRDADSTLLYLIMAIGCTTLQRAGQIPGDTTSKFEVAYPNIIQECLGRESIESVQILVLLALYSLFDPAAGASAWSIVGLVSRQAMLMGLSRRASDDATLAPTQIELRHRLYWSIFVLDRMMAASLGLPAALTDENADVPLPGLTVDEFASAERAHFAMLLQTSRHVIQLRQMEGRILQQVHFRRTTSAAALTQADRRTLVQDIRADVENWYSNGCLVSPLEPDNVPIHNSITWLSARYYFLLVLLYYPSHFHAFGPPVVPRAELLRFAQKHLQSTSALFQQRQLPLNRVTLCRLFPVGLLLMHGFAACAAACAPFPARAEVVVLVSILDAFPDGWAHAHRAACVFRQFLAAIGPGLDGGPGGAAVEDYGPLHFSQAPYVQHMGPSKDALRPHMTSLLGLMQDVLGKASCYRFLEIVEDRDSTGYAMSSSMGSQQQPLSSPLEASRLPMSAAAAAAGVAGDGRGAAGVEGGPDTVMGYGWGPLELDFL
ncbi:fungal-specific transcription factor domain-containing protein [Xylariaceae sp. FL0804]|nr:fungal-specific transcription factor domain-containing protein [Xylariaceae sp. FL0804]